MVMPGLYWCLVYAVAYPGPRGFLNNPPSGKNRAALALGKPLRSSNFTPQDYLENLWDQGSCCLHMVMPLVYGDAWFMLKAQFKKAMDLVGAEFVDRVLYYKDAWIPARDLVKNAILERHKVGDVEEEIIIIVKQSCFDSKDTESIASR